MSTEDLKPPPEYYEPFKRKQFSGHLWNDWIGTAGDLIYALEPSRRRGHQNTTPEELKEVRGKHTYAEVEQVKIARLIPKVDIDALEAEQKEKGERYNQLADRADALHKQIQEAAKSLTLITPASGYPHYEFSDGHPILALFAELKAIMVEVNELLYNKRCEFFD